MERDRISGWLVVAVGLLAALAIQLASPLAQPPLYDGLVVLEPYLWLDPPPDHPGGASSASAQIAVTAGSNDLIAVATNEAPPQAQVFGIGGSLLVAPDATLINATIQPVPKPADPPQGYIDGNVYRFTVQDQLGRTIAARSDALVTIILRPADPAVSDATIARFDGVEWKAVPTLEASLAGFEAVVTDFGDFAILAAGVSPYPTFPEGRSTVAPPPPTPGASTPPEASEPARFDSGQLPVLLGILGLIALALYLVRRRRRYTGPRGWGPGGDLDDD